MTYDKDSIEFKPFPSVHNFRDLTGQTFNRLTVLGYAGALVPKFSYWFCECACGAVIAARGGSLLSGNTKSCGCFKTDELHKRGSHQMRRTREYAAYYAALNRCTNPKADRYAHYGGRGIEFRFTSFDEFFEHLGKKPSAKHSLDRKDVNGHYEIGNVKWSTPLEQSHNKQNSVHLTHNGETYVLMEWERRTGIGRHTIQRRLKVLGWSVERTLTTPPKRSTQPSSI